MAKKAKPLAQRLAKLINKDGPVPCHCPKLGKCWIWTGKAAHKFGYGKIEVNGKTISSHRISWQFHIGSIPKTLHVLHRCDNPKCVNPKHLFLGTQRDNMRDCAFKKRRRNQNGVFNNVAKLNDKQVKEIRKVYGTGPTYAVLANRYGVAQMAICNIINYKTWKHI